MAVLSTRPDWTRATKGAPFDTVLRINGGSEGMQQAPLAADDPARTQAVLRQFTGSCQRPRKALQC